MADVTWELLGPDGRARWERAAAGALAHDAAERSARGEVVVDADDLRLLTDAAARGRILRWPALDRLRSRLPTHTPKETDR